MACASRQRTRYDMCGYSNRHFSRRQMYVVTQLSRRRNDQSEWTGPPTCQARGQRRHGSDVIDNLIDVARYQWKRLIRRAMLEPENPLHGGGRSRINGEPVERLRRIRHHASLAQRADGRYEIAGVDPRRRHAETNHVAGERPYSSPYLDSRYARYGAVETGRPVMRLTSSRG